MFFLLLPAFFLLHKSQNFVFLLNFFQENFNFAEFNWFFYMNSITSSTPNMYLMIILLNKTLLIAFSSYT